MTSIEPFSIDKINNETNFKKVVKKAHDLLLLTSAHGIPRLLRTKSIILKLLWIIVLIISAIFGSYFAINAILDYLKYDTITTVRIIHEYQAEFPSITICANPSFNAPLNKSISNLIFNQESLNPEEYFEFFQDPYYNTCIRFNSGKSILSQNVSILKSTQNGASFGLMVDINFESLDGLDYGEILIMFHNKSSPPSDMTSGNIWVFSGTSNFFKIERIFYENLGEPYNDCVKDVQNYKYNQTLINLILSLNTTYSQKECFRFCSFMFTLEKSDCNCSSTIFDFQGKCISNWFDENQSNSIFVCTHKYINDFVKNELYDMCIEYCPLECDSNEFLITPNNQFFPINGDIGSKTIDNEWLFKYKTYEEVKKKLIRIYAYYDDFRYNLISQQPKTEPFNFISNIGSILSLFFGISFVSFFEIFETIFEALLIIFSKHK